MIEKTVKRKELISWRVKPIIRKEADGIYVRYHLDENIIIDIKLDATSITALKSLKTDIGDFLEKEITLSGEVVNTWKRTEVVEDIRSDKWIKQ